MRLATCHPDRQHDANGLCRNCYARERYHITKRPRPPDYLREANLMRNYGMTIDDYDRMLKRQKGKCALCDNTEGAKTSKYGKPARLHVDHCHRTKRVRGLLCYGCNLALGLFKDDLKRLERAIKYLKAK